MDSKYEGAFRRNVRRHVQKGRDAAQSEAEAGTAKHYTAAAAQLAATAAALAAAKAVKAAAAPKKVTVKELTGTYMTRPREGGEGEGGGVGLGRSRRAPAERFARQLPSCKSEDGYCKTSSVVSPNTKARAHARVRGIRMVSIFSSKSARQSCHWVSCHGSLSAKLRPHRPLARFSTQRELPTPRSLINFSQRSDSRAYLPTEPAPGPPVKLRGASERYFRASC